MAWSAGILLLCVLAVLQGTALSLLCAPLCQPDLPNGSLVPDPTNCTRYYACVNAGDGLLPTGPIECMEGEYYDQTQDPATCTLFGSSVPDYCTTPCSPCEVKCDYVSEILPDPESIYSYNVCIQDEQALLVGCPSETRFFNYVTLGCDSGNKFTYGFCDSCEVYCTTPGQVLRDPRNCYYYYVCNPPSTPIHLKCPDNLKFNPETSTCEERVHCTLC